MAELTADHHYQLKRFVKLVDEMSRCRFIESYRKQDRTIGVSVNEAGEKQWKHPTYDMEDFRSFLTLYRQVGYAKNDKPSLNLMDILDVVCQYASCDFRADIEKTRRTTQPLMSGQYSAMQLTRYKESFEPEKILTSKEILDALLNGLIFHQQRNMRRTLRS
jgi:hypothetical protein